MTWFCGVIRVRKCWYVCCWISSRWYMDDTAEATSRRICPVLLQGECQTQIRFCNVCGADHPQGEIPQGDDLRYVVEVSVSVLLLQKVNLVFPVRQWRRSVERNIQIEFVARGSKTCCARSTKQPFSSSSIESIASLMGSCVNEPKCVSRHLHLRFEETPVPALRSRCCLESGYFIMLLLPQTKSSYGTLFWRCVWESCACWSRQSR